MPAAVLVDAEIAARFREDRPAAELLLCVSPAALAAVREMGYPVRSSDLSFNDCRHGRVAVAVERALDQFLAALPPGLKIGSVAHNLLVHRVTTLATIALRAWAAVGGRGPWLIHETNGWRITSSRKEAQLNITGRTIGSGERYGRSISTPAFPGAFRLLRNLVCATVSARRRWVLGPGGYRMGVGEALRRIPRTGQVSAQYGASTRQAYRKLLTAVAKAFVGRLDGFNIVLIPRGDRLPPEAAYVSAFRAAAERITDPAVRNVALSVSDELARSTHLCECLIADAVAPVAAIKPRLALFQNSESIASSPVAEAARAAGVRTAILNYNSLGGDGAPLATLTTKRLAKVRYANDLWDKILCWSPAGARAARIADPDVADRIVPVRPEYLPEGRRLARGGQPFRILHADNYHEWIFSQPVLVQTSDEFVKSAAELAAVVGELPGIEMEIRLKNKKECNPSVLRSIVDLPRNVSVTGTEIPFAARMEEADLLISFMSTTIEEAILMRRPVLLWGPTRRYRHLPARSEPPKPGDRSAVYVACTKEHLRAMLIAISQAHAGRPLTDEETAPFVWPSETASIGETVADLVSGDRARSGSCQHLRP